MLVRKIHTMAKMEQHPALKPLRAHMHARKEDGSQGLSTIFGYEL
jgi:hypothetical protein